MWWDEFERQLTEAFNTYDRAERRAVHSNEMKLRILNRKINADFLNATKASINLELAKTTVNMRYDEALSAFRNQVNQKFPPEVSTGGNRRTRSINQTGSYANNGGRGRGVHRGGRGRGRFGEGNWRGGRGGRGYGRGGKSSGYRRSRNDARTVRGNDGTQIEVHPSYSFTDQEWQNIPYAEQTRIHNERADYKRRRRSVGDGRSIISDVTTDISRQPPEDMSSQLQALQQRIASMESQQPSGDISTGTIMGGRNDQAKLRSRNGTNSNRSVRAIITKIGSTNATNNGQLPESPDGTAANNEMDSNADTCCLGANFKVLNITERTADVYPYNDSYKPMYGVPIVSAATLYKNKDTGESFILVIHEGLYYGPKLGHSLFNPNQLRAAGTMVWDNPYDPYRDLTIEASDDLTIELETNGTKLQFESFMPTDSELGTLPHIHLTTDDKWNPQTVKLGSVTSLPNPDHVVRQIDLVTCEKKFAYQDNKSDEAVLHSINSVLTNLGSMMKVSKIHTAIDDDIPARRTFVSYDRHKKASAESIADLWCIGIKRARATMDATTQRGTRSAILPLSRRYRADRVYNLKRLDARFATDTLFSDIKSLSQNTCAQIYSHKVGFAAVYPMVSSTGDSIGQSYKDFSHDFGIPDHLTFDGYSSQVGRNTLFMKTIRKYGSQYHISSPRRPNENPAEGAIREIKKRWYRVMLKNKVPERLWDFGLVWVCETGNLSVSSSHYANGRTSLEYITGETPDISEYLDFTFYDWVTYHPNAGLGEPSLGRWLGVSHKVGQLMSFWILAISGYYISCVTVQRLTNTEKATDEWKERMREFDEKIKERLDVKHTDLSIQAEKVPHWNRLSISDDDPEFVEDFRRVIEDSNVPEGTDDTKQTNNESNTDTVTSKIPENDSYLNMELGLARGDDDALVHAVVKKRKLDDHGLQIGTYNKNPLLDTREYEVEYIDGTVETLTANIIAENLLSQVDEEGHRQMLMHEIIDHRTNQNAINKEDGFVITKYGNKKKKMTTRGWELCVNWKDGSTDWVALKDLKNSYPVELAEYARRNNIHEEPAFSWWIPYVEKKRDHIIAKVKSKYWQRTHKYGIMIPKSVKEAYEIDRENANRLWSDAIAEEMIKVKSAVEECDKSPDELVGYQEVDLHMIFDVKLGENFRRKARMVAGGHKTSPPNSVTYSSVVARDSVRICLMLAALNDLDIQAADIENAYLTAPCREKVWTRAGMEFGEQDMGKVFIIVKALYGLKSSGAAFRAFLAERLDEMGFKSSIADPDVWLRAATKADGEEYYEYVLVYVDDLLAISVNATSVIGEVAVRFKLKKDKIEPPEVYLGGRLAEKNLNGINIWTMTSLDYVKAIVSNLEDRLLKKRLKLPSKASTPMSSDYAPELDATAELDGDGATMFQELIGELRWAIELGRVDILHEVSVLSAYQASPREGHLDQIYHIFAFLKKKPKLTLYFDPSLPKIDPNTFTGSTSEDFREQYRGAKEELPRDMPRPRGRFVMITAFVDASHASDKKTRRSHTGYIIFVNRAPIIFYSKRQSTVESSTFSSEFIALKTCTEHIIALRFKLRMFGIPIDGPANILNDNMSAVGNSSKIESTLNKKHSSIAYHLVRWNVAADVIRVGWVNTEENIADPLTKRLPAHKRDRLFGDWTY